MEDIIFKEKSSRKGNSVKNIHKREKVKIPLRNGERKRKKRERKNTDKRKRSYQRNGGH